ncbi:MAG TPA: bifunctional diaminohydroxyphosphoribosylaminopyrimidine deaminase/5-amino-6-(5-phosphoribosylamino)uracil reductase RibD [Acidobacteriaceae bacterium]
MQSGSEQEDKRWMHRALELAEKSVGRASPNPAVGCVLTKGHEPVGEGFHEYDNRDHAEIVALKQAGDRARAGTAYVTLEPCSHHGRTGPCADALLAAGVRRVVVATLDPNPVVHGRGIERLRSAGVEVTTGLLESPARQINDAFAKFTQTSIPFVTMKIAASLDGRIAPPRRPAKAPFWITGEAARAEVQRMRHAADALLTGVGTILADDPMLTDRSNLPRRRPLLRVVLDSTLRTPLESQVVRTARNDLLIFFVNASADARQALEARGVRVERLQPSEDDPAGERVSLNEALQRLAKLEITSVLTEGGAEMNAALLNGNHVDKLSIFYAPIFLGPDAVPMISSNLCWHADKDAIKELAFKKFGEDVAVDGYIRDPWSGLANRAV